jgi:hypothetical protein
MLTGLSLEWRSNRAASPHWSARLRSSRRTNLHVLHCLVCGRDLSPNTSRAWPSPVLVVLDGMRSPLTLQALPFRWRAVTCLSAVQIFYDNGRFILHEEGRSTSCSIPIKDGRNKSSVGVLFLRKDFDPGKDEPRPSDLSSQEENAKGR